MIDFIKSELGQVVEQVNSFDKNQRDCLRQMESIDRKIGSTR